MTDRYTGKEAAALLNISFTSWNYTVHLLNIKSKGGFTKEQIEEVKRFRELPKDDPYKREVYGKYKDRKEETNNIPVTSLTGQYLREKYNDPCVRKNHEKEYNRLYGRERKFKPKDLDEFKEKCLDGKIKEERAIRKEKLKQQIKQATPVKRIANPLTEYLQFDPTFVFADELREAHNEFRKDADNWEARSDAKFEATAYILTKYHYWDRDDYHRFKDHRLWLRANREVKLDFTK